MTSQYDLLDREELIILGKFHVGEMNLALNGRNFKRLTEHLESIELITEALECEEEEGEKDAE